MKLYQKERSDNLREGMGRGSLTELAFQYEPRGTTGCWKTDENKKLKETLSFKGTCLKT
jgi:hypothetical protein